MVLLDTLTALSLFILFIGVFCDIFINFGANVKTRLIMKNKLLLERIEFTGVPHNESGHKLLGIPFFDEVSEECGGMVSLLQLDEDDRWRFRLYDVGNMNFMISKEALAARDFSKVQLYVHCM